MMRHHLAAVAERGEPVSALHASEATIYGRFGYGIASRHLRMSLPRGSALRDVEGADDVRLRFDTADPDRHADLVGDCYEAARRERPGMVSRDSPAHRRRMFEDPPAHRRDGAETLRILIAEDGPGKVRGYALFRRKTVWNGALPNGTVAVRELVAHDPATARALWGRLLDLDLMGTVRLDERPTDDPLLHLLVDPRGPQPTLTDGLWVRLVDLPTALSARRYTCDVEVVLEVRDELLPANAGRWRLTAGPDGARCEPTRAAAQVELDIRELGGAFLGANTLGGYAAAGLVRALDPGTAARASAAFSWPVAAYCGWMF
jgi:predicted acetyltransferase